MIGAELNIGGDGSGGDRSGGKIGVMGAAVKLGVMGVGVNIVGNRSGG